MRISDWSSDVCSSDLAGAGADICEDEGAVAAHLLRVAVHHLEARTDKARQIDLVDHKHVRTGYAGPTLARDLVPRRHVDDIDGDVGQHGTEGRPEERRGGTERVAKCKSGGSQYHKRKKQK